MAMQSGIATSKVLILVGAGLTGSIILKNGRLSDVLAELQELVKGVNEGEASSGHYDTALLAAQIRHLAQEVRDLALSRPVTVLTGDSNSRGNLASYIVPAATVGAMGYCYMWWKARFWMPISQIKSLRLKFNFVIVFVALTAYTLFFHLLGLFLIT